MTISVEFFTEFAGSVTVCDKDGVIVWANHAAQRVFAEPGGAPLVGRNLFDCHPEPALTKLKELMAARRTNVYTIEKNGKRKLIYQTPWFEQGEYCGYIELSLELPANMPHFVRLP